MRNSMITAFKSFFTSDSNFDRFKVLGAGHVAALESRNERALKATTNQFPAIMLNFRTERRERIGGGKKYTFTGEVIVAEIDMKIDRAQEKLSKYVSDEGYVIDKLFSSPTFQVNNKNVSIFATPAETYTKSFGEVSATSFYIAEAIPCIIQFFHTS